MNVLLVTACTTTARMIVPTFTRYHPGGKGQGVEHIAMDGKNMSCGALTIRPLRQTKEDVLRGAGLAGIDKGEYEILLEGSIYSGFSKRERSVSWYSGQIREGDEADERYVRLGASSVGLTFRYDWGGWHQDTHYNVYCYIRPAGSLREPVAIDCSEVVELDNIVESGMCWKAPPALGGVGAGYGDMHMDKAGFVN